MNFNNLAEQTKALFAGTVLLNNADNIPEIYEEAAENVEAWEALQEMGEPFQVYAVELRIDYDWNAKEYEAAGVIYSDTLGAYIWPVFTFGTAWELTSPQNIFTDWED